MKKLNIKGRVIGWIILILILLFGALFGCIPSQTNPCLDGVYFGDGIELVFNNGNLTGETKCNSLNGEYFISGNYINIDLKSTKVYCMNGYKIVYFRDVKEFIITDNNLILRSNDFEIILSTNY